MDSRQDLRGFESFAAGENGAIGQMTVTREAVVAFASAFDPQPFHLDEAAGKASMLGGHAASGWHTASMMMRLIADNLLAGAKSFGSGGVRDLKWLKPVLVGDEVFGRYQVLSVRASSRGDRGHVEMRFSLDNQSGEPVFSMGCTVMMGR